MTHRAATQLPPSCSVPLQHLSLAQVKRSTGEAALFEARHQPLYFCQPRSEAHRTLNNRERFEQSAVSVPYGVECLPAFAAMTQRHGNEGCSCTHVTSSGLVGGQTRNSPKIQTRSPWGPQVWHMPKAAKTSTNTSLTHLFRQSKYASTMTIPMVLCRSNSICTVANVIPAIFSCGVAKCPIGRGEANIMAEGIDG